MDWDLHAVDGRLLIALSLLVGGTFVVNALLTAVFMGLSCRWIGLDSLDR